MDDLAPFLINPFEDEDIAPSDFLGFVAERLRWLTGEEDADGSL